MFALMLMAIFPGRVSASHSSQASWYDDGPGFYGAVHSYHWGDPRYALRVCRLDSPHTCVTVTVRDHMANAHRVIDLSPSAFAALWPNLSRSAALSRGVVKVTAATIKATLPPTDVDPFDRALRSFLSRHKWEPIR